MEKRNRVGIHGPLMLGVATVIDTVALVLTFLGIGIIVNTFINILAGCLFLLWFSLRGFGIFDGSARKPLMFFSAGMVEAVPVANAFFTWTLAVWRIIAIVKKEDAQYNKGNTRN